MVKIIRERQVHNEVTHEVIYEFDPNRPGNGFGFPCDEQGNIDETQMYPEGLENLRKCRQGNVEGRPVYFAGVRTYKHRWIEPAVAECEQCKGEATFHNHCGCYVCHECDCHQGLARCYCGWSLSGNNGISELEEMGEVIEEDY